MPIAPNILLINSPSSLVAASPRVITVYITFFRKLWPRMYTRALYGDREKKRGNSIPEAATPTAAGVLGITLINRP